jgi:hypothetical protein
MVGKQWRTLVYLNQISLINASIGRVVVDEITGIKKNGDAI